MLFPRLFLSTNSARKASRATLLSSVGRAHLGPRHRCPRLLAPIAGDGRHRFIGPHAAGDAGVARDQIQLELLQQQRGDNGDLSVLPRLLLIFTPSSVSEPVSIQ